MKIIQLTDLHIPEAGEASYDIPIRQNFLDLLKIIKDFQPEYLIVTGDLSYRQGSKTIYIWIKEQLDELAIPYRIISGNHDDPSMLAEIFNLGGHFQNGAICYHSKLGNRHAIFMDSTMGQLEQEQMEWLKDRMSQIGEEFLLFIHHPPFESGVPYMDNNHALKNKEALTEILFQHPHNIHIFSGHYHVDKTIVEKNLISYITPSCFMQIDQWTENFNVDHVRVGFREIVITGNQVRTTVVYL